MSELSAYLWLIPVLPLAGSALTPLLGPRLGDRAHWPAVVTAVLSCVLSLAVFVALVGGGSGPLDSPSYTWFQTGTVNVGFTLRADTLTAVMLVTVTFVGSLITIYSAGYMHGDPGYARYFAEIALFLFAMTGLVLANNFLVLYAFWEGVGLCSYLLIGFWFTRPSAAAAARKAFLVTRIGDLGFLIGILLLWTGFQLPDLNYKTAFATIQSQAEAGTLDQGLLTLVCLLLFCGAVGKSAQFPLHVWLPDAMEGPSPVSALIHAATMVTAGVYMVARCVPLFVLAPAAQLVVAGIGGITALLAALIALTQNDLKRVLAYSTISQLGYMFMALGCGLTKDLAAAAVVAAIFHLFTHAFFKALLFLAAGSVMHAMGNVIDLKRIGGLRNLLPTTRWTFLCGAAALAGIPFLFSGFWSKDEILAALFHASQEEGYAAAYMVLFIAALVTAGLTAFYTFRAYFLTFAGEERIPHEAGEHAHESPPVMLVPMMILAVGAVAAGFVNAEPFTSGLATILPPALQLGDAHPHLADGVTKMFLWLGSSVFALGGIGLTWWLYAARPGLAGRFARGIEGLYQLSLNKFYLDEIYNFFIVQPLSGLAQFCRLFDLYVVDGLVDFVGYVPRLFGQLFRPIQNGLVQFYALAMLLGLTVFLLALVWRG